MQYILKSNIKILHENCSIPRQPGEIETYNLHHIFVITQFFSKSVGLQQK